MRNLTLTAALAAAMFGGAAAQADYSLTILHTNDFHARFEPISKYDSGCSDADNLAGECFGGSARLATAIAERRAASNNSILVDGGDQFQGTLFYTYYKGKAAAEMMNRMAYDAMTVGNHEFDDGPEVLRGFMDAVDFPVLMSNADVSREPQLAGVLMPSTVIERAGERIGLIGLTPEDTPEISSPGPTVTFENPVVALKREVTRLEEDGVDMIVVLSHSGYVVDKAIAAEVDGIDVIVGGHSNTYLSNQSDRAEGPYPTWVESPAGDRVAIVQAYAYGKFLGELNVTWDDDGKVIAAEGEPIIMDAAVAEDSAVKTRIGILARPLDEIRNKVVADAAAAIQGDRSVCRLEECEMGNLVADAMLERTKGQGVSIAITNSGGLRASIDAGEITMGEVLTVLPFQNTLATFQLTGADVIAALENGVSGVEEVAGRFPQVAGLKFTWSPAAPAGERVGEVMVREGDDWVPIDPDKLYGVVSNNFMRAGGDGYSVFETRGRNAYDYGPGLEVVVADYLAGGGAYEPYLDGRIARN